VRYLAAWNEPEAKRRRELVAKALDRRRQLRRRGEGGPRPRQPRRHDRDSAVGISPVYRLRLASGIETHHDYLRFSWVAGGAAEAPLYIKGTDFVVVAGDGRIKSVVGFVDAAPARA